MVNKKNRILIFSLITLLIIISIIFSIKVRDRKIDENIEQFQNAALLLSKQFDDDVLLSDVNYDFVSEYQIPFDGAAVVVDSNMVTLYHLNSELIGMVVPITTIQEKINESLSKESDDDKDIFFTYEFDGNEKVAYLHNHSNRLMFIVIASEENYR
jgi:hypothetical protein